MENRKKEFKWFTIPQYRQEEEYLSAMHGKGRKLSKITFPGFYHFEKCEPARVTYRLDYNQEGIANKEEYVRMFSDCGWNYLFDFVGYSYFYKEGAADSEDEEIFCDDSSRLDMMKRVFKGRVVPLILLFACFILPQLCVTTMGYGRGGIAQDVLSIALLVLAGLYWVIFAAMAVQFYHYEKRLKPEDTGIKYKYAGVCAGLLMLLLVIAAIFINGKKSVFSVVENENGFTIEAERLNKAVEMEYELKEGDIIEVSHEYEAGQIYISVGMENREPVFYGNSYSELEDFSLLIQEDGRYIIKCSGRNAKGTIQFVIKELEAFSETP